MSAFASSDVLAQALQQSLKDLERGFANFFEKRADFAEFHKKGRKDSFRIPKASRWTTRTGASNCPKWERHRQPGERQSLHLHSERA
jgi:putative transposase